MNSFRGRNSRSKIVRIKKVLVRLSECLTQGRIKLFGAPRQ